MCLSPQQPKSVSLFYTQLYFWFFFFPSFSYYSLSSFSLFLSSVSYVLNLFWIGSFWGMHGVQCRNNDAVSGSETANRCEEEWRTAKLLSFKTISFFIWWAHRICNTTGHSNMYTMSFTVPKRIYWMFQAYNLEL